MKQFLTTLILASLALSLLGGSITFSSSDVYYSDDAASSSLSSSSFSFKSKRLRIGALGRDRDLNALLSPGLVSFPEFGMDMGEVSFTGIKANLDKAKFIYVSDPYNLFSFKFSYPSFDYAFAYYLPGNGNGDMLTPTKERGGYGGLASRLSFHRWHMLMYAQLSYSEDLSAHLHYGAGLEGFGMYAIYSRGDYILYDDGDIVVRERLEFGFGNEILEYKAELRKLRDPFVNGTYRGHEGREEVRVRLGEFSLSSISSGEFTEEGKYGSSYKIVASYKGFSLGVDDGLGQVFSFRDERVYAYLGPSSFSYGFSFGPVSFRLYSSGAFSVRAKIGGL